MEEHGGGVVLVITLLFFGAGGHVNTSGILNLLAFGVQHPLPTELHVSSSSITFLTLLFITSLVVVVVVPTEEEVEEVEEEEEVTVAQYSQLGLSIVVVSCSFFFLPSSFCHFILVVLVEAAGAIS